MANRGLTNVGVGCSCCVWILCLIACVSPYWVWSWGYDSWRYSGWASYDVTIGSGAWTAGYGSARSYNCQYYSSYRYTACWGDTWISWTEDGLNKACTNQTGCMVNGEDYTNGLRQSLEEFDICKDGEFTQPNTIWWVKGLATTAVCTSLFSVIIGFFSLNDSSKGVAAGACMFLTTILTVAAFSLYASWSYADAIRDGKIGIILPSAYSGCSYTQGPLNVDYGYGPAFGAEVSAFVLALFTTVIIVVAAGGDSDDMGDGKGSYGGGKFV